MDFGDGTAAYSIKMSHAVGDGTTFFQLVSQVSSYMNGRTPSPIDWNNPLKATHEIYPENFSERDYERSYGLPFGWGVAKVWISMNYIFDTILYYSFSHLVSIRKESKNASQAKL